MSGAYATARYSLSFSLLLSGAPETEDSPSHDTPGDYYGVFERRLNGGRWTFSRDLVPQEGTGRRSGLLQDGNVRQVPAAEDGEAELRDDLPARHQLQAAATAAVGTVNVQLYIYVHPLLPRLNQMTGFLS